ncbi:CBU_0592 family membrane protein [Kiloniella sp.]|uniref:CBU_0592 family membrane protein n=1 Tax=Kiloniella sp. TaxID=1938587 RepID=UPI003B011C8E
MLIDAIGMLGVSMILSTYALVQLDRIDVKNISYSLVNALGAGLILISLAVDFNLSAFVIESCWLLISIGGIYASLKKRRKG